MGGGSVRKKKEKGFADVLKTWIQEVFLSPKRKGGSLTKRHIKREGGSVPRNGRKTTKRKKG